MINNNYHRVRGGGNPTTAYHYYYYPQRRQKTTTTTTKTMIPRKAALSLTPKARDVFRRMISATGSVGIVLKYEISSQHALRMAFKFDLVKDANAELTDQDEG